MSHTFKLVNKSPINGANSGNNILLTFNDQQTWIERYVSSQVADAFIVGESFPIEKILGS